MRSLLPLLIFLLFPYQISPQQADDAQDNFKQKYLAELKIIGKEFTNDLYPNHAKIYSLPEDQFVAKIELVRKKFIAVLESYKSNLDGKYVSGQEVEIKYYFDKLLIEYPLNHDVYLGETSKAPSKIAERLKGNLADFNKSELLANSDFTNYVKAFLSYRVELELRKSSYRKSDNRHLDAVWNLLPEFFSDRACLWFWQADYLYNHIDNDGIKDIEKTYDNFKTTCKDAALVKKIEALYSEDAAGRQGHLIKPYKTVSAFSLDLHMFLPKNVTGGGKRPAIIYFHGGSWSEGKPDWFFAACESYAKKGWVAIAVEYRTYGRHGTLPFEAVKDARSAIRWVRQHAGEFNIDSERVVASGNSAGGHLVLSAALADKWNEKTDDLKISPAPNVLLINSGVFDLTDQTTAWIRKDLRDKDLVKEISPNYLIKSLPPTLIIHGTNDRNVPYESAKIFVDKMSAAGNTTIEFQTLEGAGHFIWFDPKYADKVGGFRSEFLNKLGYR